MTLMLKVNCRACNRKSDEFKHLLKETIIDDEVKTFAALLNYCTTIEGFGENHESGMPQHICNICVEHLLQSYLFKKMVLRNETDNRERLQVQKQSKKDPVVFVKEEQVVKQEINFEDSMEPDEFISENVEIFEGNNVKPEYKCKDLVQIDANYQFADCESINMQSENQKNDFLENVSRDYEENSNDIVIINEADAQNYEYVNCSEAKEYNYIDNDDKDEKCAEEQLAENLNENKDKQKRKYIKKNNLTEADLICQYCGKVFEKMSRLTEHTYIHTGEKPHVCKICGKKSRTKTHNNVHMLIHSDEKRYKCYICGLRYRNSSTLRVHERSHSNAKPYACKLCDKRFQTADLRKLHFMIHTGERPFICGTCGKSYRENRFLKAHIITHEDANSYQCEVCGTGFTRKESYQRHLLLHTNEYPYKCDVCGRPLRTSRDLAVHQLLHSVKPSYQCTKCGKVFRNSSSLSRHMLIYEGI